MPTIDDIRHALNGAKFLSKLDMNKAYHQVELHPDSRHLTTFTTHIGLYRYRRLFGLSSAAEIFQNVIATVLRGIPNQINVADDILVFGRTKQEHDEALDRVLKRLNDPGASLNRKKCEFCKPEIVFFGMKFLGEGMAPLSSRVKALQEAQPPRSPSEVRSILGSLNYSASFVKDMAIITEPLKELARGDTPWEWSERHQEALETVKNALLTGAALGHYKPEWSTEVVVDASPVGLGAILRQHDPVDNSRRHVVSYKSRTLTGPESRYSQLEREALAVVWGCEKHHLYVYAHAFTVITDNKAIESIFSKPNSKPTPRIERLLHRMTVYPDTTIIYQPGEYNPADYLSRQPVDDDQSPDDDLTGEFTVNVVVPDLYLAVSKAQL